MGEIKRAMVMMICAYDLSTGRITTANYGTKNRVSYNRSTEGKLVGAYIDPSLHYIHNWNVIPKTARSFSFDKANIEADGDDTTAISGLPGGTLVTWPDGEITEINDGVLEFAVDLVGTHTFIIDAVAHLKQEVSIEAIATA